MQEISIAVISIVHALSIFKKKLDKDCCMGGASQFGWIFWLMSTRDSTVSTSEHWDYKHQLHLQMGSEPSFSSLQVLLISKHFTGWTASWFLLEVPWNINLIQSVLHIKRMEWVDKYKQKYRIYFLCVTKVSQCRLDWPQTCSSSLSIQTDLFIRKVSGEKNYK